jgi:glycosyltransferase involved in cell wall biosynthesis
VAERYGIVRISVVLCTHTPERFEHLVDAARSVQAGTYEDVELVLVSDGSPAVSELMRDEFGAAIASGACLVEELEENSGLLAARNRGAAAASGDIVAFLDDDALADERWLERLIEPYESGDRLAVGGRVTPAWVAPDGAPAFLPEEFYWLVGVTHRGFGPGGGIEGVSSEGEVRNTNGSNLSFEAAVFSGLGGFDTAIVGRKGSNHLQGGETELCARFAAEHGEGVWYVPDARVAHKVFEYRTELAWLLNRAFWQGYSKRVMSRLTRDAQTEEQSFLGDLLTRFLPGRVWSLIRNRALGEAPRIGFILGATAAVSLGYAYAMLVWR